MMIYEYLILCFWMDMFSKLQTKIMQPPQDQIDGENNAHFKMIKKVEKIILASRSVLCICILQCTSCFPKNSGED